jgi:hypothetical protein
MLDVAMPNKARSHVLPVQSAVPSVNDDPMDIPVYKPMYNPPQIALTGGEVCTWSGPELNIVT